MAIKCNPKVIKVLERAAKIAEENKQEAFGCPHVMLALMETNDFKSAADVLEDYEDFEIFVEHAVKKYKIDDSAVSSLSRGLKGKDWLMAEQVLDKIHKKLKPGIKSDEVLLAHIFWAACADSECFHMEDRLDSYEVSKVQFAVDIATYADLTPADVDIDKIVDFSIELDLDGNKVRFTSRKRSDPMEGVPEEKAPAGPSLFGPRSAEDEFSRYCVDLVEMAKSYNKPFVGREDVLERTLQVLCKAEKSNPCHVGEPGVGKSAVTKGLAKMILENKVPEVLKGSKLYELDPTSLVAGTCYRGDFEKRIKMVLDKLSKMEKPILFIDEIHMLIGAGAGGSGNMDAANIMKPYLTEGKIKFIGATTYDEYSSYIEKDPALARRFQKIDIKEPTPEEAVKILEGLKERYEDYHKVTYTPEAIRAAVDLTAKHIHDRYLPDKAIDMIDEAGAYLNIHEELGTVVTDSMISDVVSTVCNVPKKSMEEDQSEKIAVLDTVLNSRVFGQEEAVKLVTDSIQISKSGLGDENKPIGSFLFVGPSGVGKTELAKTLADTMDMKLLRFDMSEYSMPHSVQNLIGAPKSYVGYEEGGVLTNAVIRNPYSVVLFDEIEKAHPDVFKIFLQILDYGMLTDNHGKKVDFKNTIIIMTSNAGITMANKATPGFVRASSSGINKDAIMEVVNTTFTSEFRNRLNGIVLFNGLSKEVSLMIAKKELDLVALKLIDKGINVTFTDACIKEIARLGTSPEYGARELKRIVDDKIKKIFIQMILKKTAPKTCIVDYDKTFEVVPVTETVPV